MVPVRLSLKYQEDYPAGTKISCSHRGYISNASSGYNHHVPHILISSVLAQAHARVSSHMAATPCNPMEKNCSWQICGVTWSYRNHQLLRMSGPGSPEFASSSKKLQIQSWALSCLSRAFVASSPCEVTPVLTVPTTFCLPPRQLQVFGWDLKVRTDLCVSYWTVLAYHSDEASLREWCLDKLSAEDQGGQSIVHLLELIHNIFRHHWLREANQSSSYLLLRHWKCLLEIGFVSGNCTAEAQFFPLSPERVNWEDQQYCSHYTFQIGPGWRGVGSAENKSVGEQ